MNIAFLEALASALDVIAARPPQGGLVVTGSGACFSAGADVKEVPGYGDAEMARLASLAGRAFGTLFTLPVPTVAALNGHAIGGGLILALACDRRLARAGDLRLSLPEVAVGVAYPAGAFVVVDETLDAASKRRMVLDGEAVAPADALAAGILDGIEPASGLIETAVATARRLAALKGFATIKAQLQERARARLTALDLDG